MLRSLLSFCLIAYSLAISSSSIIEVSNQISSNVVRNMSLSIRQFQNRTETEIIAAKKSIKYVHDKFGFYCSSGLSEAVYAYNRSGSTTQISLMSATIGVIQFLEIVLANLTITSGFETDSRKKIGKRDLSDFVTSLKKRSFFKKKPEISPVQIGVLVSGLSVLESDETFGLILSLF